MRLQDDFEKTLSQNGVMMGKFQKTGVTSSKNVMIPVGVDNENKVTHMFVLNYEGFPEGGLNNFSEITGIRFQESLAGMRIFQGPLEHSMQRGFVATLLKISRSIDYCDKHTRFHGIRTGLWAQKLAQGLSLSQKDVENISMAGKLHDVGKVFIPKRILTKPSCLDQDEWRMVQKHPSLGCMLMDPSQELEPIIPMVVAHHERYDGSGYPKGLLGENIPLGARIISVADAFATITEGRIYKRPATFTEAIHELERNSHNQFDPVIVSTMKRLVDSGTVKDWMGSW